jgi:hypothetical protein
MEIINDKLEIRMKDGFVLPRGTRLRLTFFNKPYVCHIQEVIARPNSNWPIWTLRITSLPRYCSDFVAPTLEELEEQAADGIVDSVAGYGVEPDGYDQEGSPSWMLALGLI